MSPLEEKLYKLYDDSNRLLTFSEAKNIGLIAFNSGVIVGVSKLIQDFQSVEWFLIILYYVLTLNLISVIIAFMSIMPQIKQKESNVEENKSDNLIYFGRVASMKPKEFLKAFTTRYRLKSTNPVYELDLCRQIIITSQITLRKMIFFRIACYFTLSGIATPIAVLIYKKISVKNN